MSQEQTQKNNSIGAWKKQTPKGEVISFTINGQRYNMWPNGRKNAEKQPDFNIYEDNYVKPENTGYAPQPRVAVQPQQQYVPQQPQYVQPQQQYAQQQPQPQPQQGFVPASNGLNF